MLNSEEMKVRELVTRTTEVLKRASAGPDDIGARYARLLELLWQPKPAPSLSPTATHRSSDLLMQNTLNRLPEQSHHVHFSPANDFSWLDLEAVGDFVSGDQMPGTGTLAFDAFQQEPDLYQSGQDRSQSWQMSPWVGDMAGNLLF
jgi:hypothetical protein